jgi:hypothetical protein
METLGVDCEENVLRSVEESSLHTLNNKWTLWAHLPHDTNWTADSYKEIYTMDTIESAITLVNTLPDKLIKNCMLFIMREGIKPMWEDEKNRAGGCFSYKVNNKNIISMWKKLVYKLVCEDLVCDKKLTSKINGITISPKRNFCIVKLWLTDCLIKNPQTIVPIHGLPQQGCLFKKHNPEY